MICNKSFDDDVHADLDIVLQRATSKDPDLRYDNALVMARDFATILAGDASGLGDTGASTIDILSITQQVHLDITLYLRQTIALNN